MPFEYLLVLSVHLTTIYLSWKIIPCDMMLLLVPYVFSEGVATFLDRVTQDMVHNHKLSNTQNTTSLQRFSRRFSQEKSICVTCLLTLIKSLINFNQTKNK